MPTRVVNNVLNATTIDILNTIRQNAPFEYQSKVPVVTTAHDLPKVGEAICGTPTLANHFVHELVNRIAYVRIKSATFNNPYTDLKKGYLTFGETIEEVFVEIAKAKEFSAEKAEQREFKRTIPYVKTAFHVINWRVVYPITIQNEDLRMAFTSFGGVEDLIAKIINSIYTAAEYDEFLLFKYLLIKAVTKGKMYPQSFDSTDIKNAAKVFRGVSNRLEFIDTKYNAAGVHTNTKKEDQYIFMDADFNAEYDVDVLASAFNMGKAEFMGKLKKIDSFTSFDNERFNVIRSECDGLEEVTAAELALMADVKAIVVDGEWFQVYDNLAQMEETKVSSGLYWNYFYHNWKTISSSPFSNAVAFVAGASNVTVPASLGYTVSSVLVNPTKDGTPSNGDKGHAIITLEASDATLVTLGNTNAVFMQTEDMTEDGVAVQRYGAFIVPVEYVSASSKWVFDVTTDEPITANVAGQLYAESTATIGDGDDLPVVGAAITLAKVV